MKRKSIALILICFMALQLFPSATVQGKESNYTYTYDYWGLVRESPDAYEAEAFITGEELGIGDFKDPQGMFVRDNRIYICDTGNNRVVVLERDTGSVRVADEFGSFTGDTSNTALSGPQDIYVAKNGDMYICDTGNQRVIHLDAGYHLIKELGRPVDETIDASSDFLPMKVVADRAGRVLVLVKNYNKGFVEYKNNGEFAGYLGANEVKFHMSDYIWKLISTKAQRAQMKQFVPTEYNNLAIDSSDFIYCTTSVFRTNELRSDQAKPIRKLNAMGADILVKNGEYPPIGDLDWGNAAGASGPSKLIDITALDNDIYFAIDQTRSRIFGYDTQGNLLYAFGNIGNKLGYFLYPTALEHMGSDLLILDSKTAGITIMTLTQYGQLINAALSEYKKGNYEVSANYWRKVLTQNGNYELAYIGIGRALMRQGDYKKAMEYFKLSFDDHNYSKAFQLYRKEWIEKNIGWLVAIFFGLILIPSLVGFIKKIKREVDET